MVKTIFEVIKFGIWQSQQIFNYIPLYSSIDSSIFLSRFFFFIIEKRSINGTNKLSNLKKKNDKNKKPNFVDNSSF